MAWIRIDDHFDEHPKLAKAGPLGWALWLAGLAYCNRNLTDGFIPWTVARKLVNWTYLDPEDEPGRRRLWAIGISSGMSGEDVTSDHVIALLVHAGLWDETDDGYRIHDYDQYQPSRAQIEAGRERNADRQRRFRERNAESNADVTPLLTDDVTPASRTRNNAPNPNTNPNTGEDNDVLDAAASKTRAQRAVVAGSPWSVLVAFLEAVGADPAASMAPAWKNKMLATAKRLIEQGYAEDAVRACAGYMLSQDWRTAPFDLLDLERYIGKWETAGKPDREAPRRSSKPDANQRTRDEYARNMAIAEATLGTGRR